MSSRPITAWQQAPRPHRRQGPIRFLAAIAALTASLLWSVFGFTNNPLQLLVFGQGLTDEMEIAAIGPLMDACPSPARTSQFGLGAWDVLSRYGRVTQIYAALVPTITPASPPMTPADYQELRNAAGTIEWAPSRDLPAPAGLTGVVQLVALRCDADSGFIAIRPDGHRNTEFPFFDLDTPDYELYRVTFDAMTADHIRKLVGDNFKVARGF